MLHKWANAHQLICKYSIWWKGTQPVVPGDNNLKRGVIYLLHDKLVARHLGISNTYELVKLAQHETPCGKICTTCQESKINTRPLKPAMIPITPAHSLPFQTIAMNFITKLPLAGGIDTFHTRTDHDCSKAIILIPCKETITVDGVAALLLCYLFLRFSIPKKFISDSDTRFVTAT